MIKTCVIITVKLVLRVAQTWGKWNLQLWSLIISLSAMICVISMKWKSMQM